VKQSVVQIDRIKSSSRIRIGNVSGLKPAEARLARQPGCPSFSMIGCIFTRTRLGPICLQPREPLVARPNQVVTRRRLTTACTHVAKVELTAKYAHHPGGNGVGTDDLHVRFIPYLIKRRQSYALRQGGQEGTLRIPGGMKAVIILWVGRPCTKPEPVNTSYSQKC
jgi:hypothetical protein